MYKASDVLHPRPARCASQQLHLRGRVHNPWVTPPHSEDEGDGGVFFEHFGRPRVDPFSGGSQKDPVPSGLSSSFSSSADSSKKTHANSELNGPAAPVHPKLKAVKFSTNKLPQLGSDTKTQNGSGPSRSSSPLQNSSSSFSAFQSSEGRLLFEHIPNDFPKSDFEAISLISPTKDEYHRMSKR